MDDRVPDVDLMPCPFCGEKPTMKAGKPDKWNLREWYICCANDECMVAPHATPYTDDRFVIEQWNSRADFSNTVKSRVLDALEQAVRCLEHVERAKASGDEFPICSAVIALGHKALRDAGED